MGELRVAMVGTPDAANFGDLLFPSIARHELQERLGELQLTLYGYRGLSGAHWPHAVRSLGDLPEQIGDFDMMLIGGGHLVHNEPLIANGYRPDDPRVHHPLGLWLVPALLAHAAGVPLAWNAVGASDLPGWLAPLVVAALEGSAYVAVRDEGSVAMLAALAPRARLHLVPDTALGVGVVIDAGARQAAAELLAGAGIGDRGYVVVQSTVHLGGVADALRAALAAARKRDLAVLELPIGPIHGDAPGLLDLAGDVVALDHWPPAPVLAALIAGAQAIIAQSLHANLVGFATGVTCLRMPTPRGLKYDQLDDLPGVHVLGDDGGLAALANARSAPDVLGAAARSAIRGRLDTHWDRIATLAGTRTTGPAAALTQLVARVPALLDACAAQAAELKRRADDADELRAACVHEVEHAGREADLARALALRERDLAAARARCDDLQASLVAADELDYLRRRDATLQRIVEGGWWRLRGRLLPLLHLAGRSR